VLEHSYNLSNQGYYKQCPFVSDLIPAINYRATTSIDALSHALATGPNILVYIGMSYSRQGFKD
jgi:hypothetical protein